MGVSPSFPAFCFDTLGIWEKLRSSPKDRSVKIECAATAAWSGTTKQINTQQFIP